MAGDQWSEMITSIRPYLWTSVAVHLIWVWIRLFSPKCYLAIPGVFVVTVNCEKGANIVYQMDSESKKGLSGTLFHSTELIKHPWTQEWMWYKGNIEQMSLTWEKKNKHTIFQKDFYD